MDRVWSHTERPFGSRATALAIATCALATAAASFPVQAQTFPSRPVQMIVGYAAGGTGDVVARIISDKLAATLGQPVVIENRPGASGAIAVQSVIRAAPDGHTVLVGQTGEMAVNQHRAKGAGYDPDADLQPVALGAVVPLALVVPPKAPYDSLQGLLAAARAAPNGLSFASAGAGTPGHFAGELLKSKVDGKLLHVPYKGAAPALNDLLGAHVDLYFSGFPAVMPHVRAGALKMLALSSGRRSDASPETPTVRELTGIEDFDLTLWVGFFVPRATPRDAVTRLNAEINATLADAGVKAKLLEAGADVTPLSVEETTAFVRAESGKYLRIIKETGVSPE